MKTFFLMVLIIGLFLFPLQTKAEESIYLAIQDVSPEFLEKTAPNLSETLQKPKKGNEIYNEGENFIPRLKTKIESLDNDVKTPLEAEVEYDVLFDRTPIFSEYTKMEFEKGPIETLDPSFVYQGQMNFDFLHSGHSTKYDSPVAELVLKGKLRNEKIYYNLTFDMLSYDKYNFFQTFFKDYSLIFETIPNNKISVGRFRTPIGIEGGMSSYTLPFIARSQISRNFGSVRGMGVKVIGDYKYVDYNIGVTSTDRQYNDFFPGVEFNGLVNFMPLENTDGRYGVLKVGGGLNAGHKNFDYNVVGAYLSYKFRKFALESEYAISNGSNGNEGLTRNKAQGVYTTLSYNITKKLQVLARYDYFDANRKMSGKNITEYTAGINYFIKGSALKLMLNFTHRKPDDEKVSNRIMIGTQVIF